MYFKSACLDKHNGNSNFRPTCGWRRTFVIKPFSLLGGNTDICPEASRRRSTRQRIIVVHLTTHFEVKSYSAPRTVPDRNTTETSKPATYRAQTSKNKCFPVFRDVEGNPTFETATKLLHDPKLWVGLSALPRISRYGSKLVHILQVWTPGSPDTSDFMFVLHTNKRVHTLNDLYWENVHLRSQSHDPTHSCRATICNMYQSFRFNPEKLYIAHNLVLSPNI